MTISANVVDYDQVTAGYESGLNTQLRGFRGGARFLEHWVHDPDPVKSIVNMIEAAGTAGLPDVTVILGAGTQAAVDMARLDKLAAELGQVAKEERPAFGRSYQTPFADRIRHEVTAQAGAAVIAVGAISSYDDVNSIRSTARQWRGSSRRRSPTRGHPPRARGWRGSKPAATAGS